MVQSIDHPELLYLEARKLPNASGFKAPMFTTGRPDGPPLWIVVHDMEGAETATIAEDLGKYQAGGAQGRSVSSHYCADRDSVVQCVKLQDSAWTVGNRMGNNRGINWEFAGRANQTREQWLDDFGRAMFAVAAPIIRADAARFGIPLRRCTLDDLRNRRPGITSHNDLGVVYGGTDHTDPGPNFPWDVFMAVLLGGSSEEDDVTTICVQGETSDQVGRMQTAHRRVDPTLPASYVDRQYGPTTAATHARLIAAGDGKKCTTGDLALLNTIALDREGGSDEDGLSATERAAVEDIAEQAADEAIADAVVTTTITPGE